MLTVFQANAERSPNAVAILAPGRQPASYDALVHQVMTMSQYLRDAGISATDRVALAVPNGPDLAVAVLGTIAAAACAPLAPDQPSIEFVHQLTDLNARAVIIQRGHDTAAREAAASIGIPVIELEPRPIAGAFTLTREGSAIGASGAHVENTDVALLLFTSGTTSKPKLVPLTEQNLLRSASNVAITLELGAGDRCLNVMPLFHIHGLVAALFASLLSGGSVVCTSGFRGSDVPGWLDEYRPTWYTAVPTIHQAMLDAARHAAAEGNALRDTFRFIRSSSAALPVRVLEQLEASFGVPVIEAYGMTEAAHQMASNPLSGQRRKPGTVGKSAGSEIAVLDDTGSVLPPGAVGEIGIRGPSVTAGYLDNPVANAEAFVNGWFRTGDQGSLDDDGYLTITGRLKEIINRGGEKVAPREVDDALLEHADVVHAAAFATPHPRLGEEVAAVVVLRDGAEVTAAELRVFVSNRLAPFKVPRRVIVLDEIPRGRTGKIERSNLATTLGLDQASGTRSVDAPRVEPVDDLERELVAIWQSVLAIDEPPSTDIDFFELGGDSLYATELLTDIEAAFGRRLTATTFLTGATVREMANALRGAPRVDSGASIVPVQPAGSKPPLFCLLRGGSVVTVRHFTATLGSDQPVYALWYPTMHGPPDAAGSVEEIAAACSDAVREVRPDGPYFLFGHSLGGVVIYETARRLAGLGHEVGLVVLADCMHPDILRELWRRKPARRRARKLLSRKGPRIVAGRLLRMLGLRKPVAKVRSNPFVPGTDVLYDRAAARQRELDYVPGPAPAPVAILATRSYLERGRTSDLGWAPLLEAGWEAHEVPGSHNSMIGEPYVHVLAARLAECLRRADVSSSS